MRKSLTSGWARTLRTARAAAATLVVASALASCETLGGDPPAPAAKQYVPVEFAMPPESEVKRDGTIAVGDSQNWYGTMTLTSGRDLDEVHQFYSNALAAQGWEPLSALIADRVVLQFVNRQRGRSCIVMIQRDGGLFGNTLVQIIISPLTGAPR